MATVWRSDPDYEAMRRRMVWNERIPERFPDVIVSVTSDADVIEAVKLARSRGLRIAVREKAATAGSMPRCAMVEC